MEYEDRYWVYTNAIGKGNNFSFTVTGENQIVKLIIKPYKDMDSTDYALCSVPKYKKLTAKCGKYSAEAGKL